MQHTYKFIIRNSKFVIISVFVFMILIIPALSLAQETSANLIPCGTKANPKPCDFNSFMALINKVINFILFSMAVPIAAIMFAYAGFKLVTAGGESEHARSGAKEIFTNTVIGLIIAVAAWLIIKTLLIIFGFKDVGMFFK